MDIFLFSLIQSIIISIHSYVVDNGESFIPATTWMTQEFPSFWSTPQLDLRMLLNVHLEENERILLLLFLFCLRVIIVVVVVLLESYYHCCCCSCFA